MIRTGRGIVKREIARRPDMKLTDTRFSRSRNLLMLARMMVLQARMLRNAGQRDASRRLVRRARAISRLGWVTAG